MPAQINFTAPGLFPEGIAYDPFQNWFYVSSITEGTIGIVLPDGTYKSFITDPALTMTTGLKVDKAHKVLWVSNAPNGVGTYQLGTGDRIFYTDLSTLVPGAPIFINDLALDPQGNAYVTNSFSPVVYKVDREGNAEVFFQNEAFATVPGEFGFNGIVYDERGYLLVAMSSRNQILRIPVRNPDDYSIIQLDSPISTPDGLLLSKDGKQLVIVSGDRVLSFLSNDQWQTGQLSTSFVVGPEFPTTLASDGKRVYVLFAHLDKFFGGQSQTIFTVQEVPLNTKDSF